MQNGPGMKSLAAVFLWLPLLWAALPARATAAESFVLRDSDGRFLRMDKQGTVRADRLFPTPREAFTLVSDRKEPLVLEDSARRFLVIEGSDTRRVRVGRAGGEMTDQPVEIYRLGEVSSAIRSGLALAIRAVVIAELSNEEYKKIRRRKKEEWVELPAPTLRNWRRTRRHRVLSMDEEYHIQARLDGPPTIDIAHMPLLKGYDRPEVGYLMFVVRARVPVLGRVRYKVPKTLSVSTGFRAEIVLNLVGQIRADRKDDRAALQPPEVLELGVTLHSLDISNDVLNAARQPIREMINRELARKKGRIREQANKTIRKAVDDVGARHPLLGLFAVRFWNRGKWGKAESPRVPTGNAAFPLFQKRTLNLSPGLPDRWTHSGHPETLEGTVG